VVPSTSFQGCNGCTGIKHTTIDKNVCRLGGGGAGGAGTPVGDPGAAGVADGLGLYFNGTGVGNNTLPLDNTLIAANLQLRRRAAPLFFTTAQTSGE